MANKPQELVEANQEAHLIVENEKQEQCNHTSWEKVQAIDEEYWRCTDCSITNSEPLSPEEVAEYKPYMKLPEWKRNV